MVENQHFDNIHYLANRSIITLTSINPDWMGLYPTMSAQNQGLAGHATRVAKACLSILDSLQFGTENQIPADCCHVLGGEF